MIAANFPELQIVMSHAGYPWVLESVLLAWKYPNVYLELAAHRPVHDHERRGAAGTRHTAVQAELVGRHRLHGRDHHWQVRGQAAGHDGVDGEFFKGTPTVFGRDIADKLLGIVVAHHAPYQFWSRRHDGEAISPAALHEELNGGYGVINGDFRGRQRFAHAVLSLLVCQ